MPPSYNPAPSRPTLKLPAGACDTHVHIFGPRDNFPYSPTRAFTPTDTPKETLFALHAMLGIERCVIVQSNAHGFDSSAAADAIAAKGGSYLGVALAPTNVSDDELKRLAATGFRGVRFNYAHHLGRGAPIEEVIALSRRLAPFDLHLQIHFENDLITDLAPWLKRSSVPVVIDHMGRTDASLGLDQPLFQELLRLLDDERFHIKVSGCDRITRQGPPYADAVPFGRRLVSEFGDRTFWGTDWPHPNHTGPIPDDGVLVDFIAQIAPSERARQALLVDNPRRFYRFTA
ncbi:MAG: amidohydrolase family protein [Rhizobiales bacterium]|nr:amidohydrolase family protein [Hyphomicrobiales bacterium]